LFDIGRIYPKKPGEKKRSSLSREEKISVNETESKGARKGGVDEGPNQHYERSGDN